MRQQGRVAGPDQGTVILPLLMDILSSSVQSINWLARI